MFAASGAAVLLAVAAVGVVVWRWAAGDRITAVPTCAVLAAALPALVDGMWTVRRSEPARPVSDSAVSCLFEVVAADRRFTGGVTVLLVADPDADRLRREVRDGPCYGDPQTGTTDNGYVASKECAEVINGQARTGLFAATQARFTHVVAAFSSPSAPQPDIVGYARRTAHATAEQTLTLPSTT